MGPKLFLVPGAGSEVSLPLDCEGYGGRAVKSSKPSSYPIVSGNSQPVVPAMVVPSYFEGLVDSSSLLNAAKIPPGTDLEMPQHIIGRRVGSEPAMMRTKTSALNKSCQWSDASRSRQEHSHIAKRQWRPGIRNICHIGHVPGHVPDLCERRGCSTTRGQLHQRSVGMLQTNQSPPAISALRLHFVLVLSCSDQTI